MFKERREANGLKQSVQGQWAEAECARRVGGDEVIKGPGVDWAHHVGTCRWRVGTLEREQRLKNDSSETLVKRDTSNKLWWLGSFGWWWRAEWWESWIMNLFGRQSGPDCCCVGHWRPSAITWGVRCRKVLRTPSTYRSSRVILTMKSTAWCTSYYLNTHRRVYNY